ncbi:hypothetical protein PVK06_047802 [Gossypium arboreum]|uniref:Uncharacterized protein n=1 Tax=Gossypium arboreum TaxID=29729 RepID=A0ABR0MEJ3_GOSAR|nr:hypothetical protein PVK06_047802 [Gossypium arboreum]
MGITTILGEAQAKGKEKELVTTIIHTSPILALHKVPSPQMEPTQVVDSPVHTTGPP